MMKFGFLKSENFAKLIDGTEIRVEGEELAEGAAVYVVTEEGDIPAPDGVHELEDGTKVETKDGMIASIEVKEEVEGEMEEEVIEEEKKEEMEEEIKEEVKEEIVEKLEEVIEDKEEVEMEEEVKDEAADKIVEVNRSNP
jgi:hypothetical protein